MSTIRNAIRDRVLVTGWIMLILSVCIFCIPLLFGADTYFGFFALNFALAIAYFFIPRFANDKPAEHRVHYKSIKLILFLISAYALNRELQVFAASPAWFTLLLVLICLNYLVSVFFPSLPQWSRYALFFICGLSIVVFVYLSLYLLPLYVVSVVGMIALGISVHTFVPFFFILLTVQLVGRLAGTARGYWISFFSGIACTLIVCFIFISVWNRDVRQLNEAYSTAMVDGDNKLPLWVQVAQKAEPGGIGEKILKTDLVYKVKNWDDNIFWNLPQRNFGDEQPVHDPLVVLANGFSKGVLLSSDDRIKILESQYNARHQALRRLWTGEHLQTQQVTTHIKVWPHLHLAYTEKFITVSNRKEVRSWGNQEEAIYTLHMPEGAVVTSLSLWIDGREEKGVLTTSQKADSAYTAIVGYERRDPSLITWQEGNTVTVRVFPVTAGSNRTFKVGITAPLRSDEGQLAYDNTWFDGPDASAAQETVRLEMETDPATFLRNASYRSSDDGVFTTSRKYQPAWKLQFEDRGLKPEYFSFNGFRYGIIPYDRSRVPVAITDVYLDINHSWNREELNSVLEMLKGKRIWLYNGSLQLLDEKNRSRLLPALRDEQFSLFPFHLIRDRQHSLVISKSGSYSPNLRDLEGSSFLKEMKAKLSGERVKVFHIGNEFSPYIRSLKEFRLFDFECGNTALLKKLLEKNMFVSNPESDNAVIIHSANVAIIKTAGNGGGTAPDHLMRLFAYNHIMQQLGASSLTHAADDSTCIKEAQEGYVISPVSSLIVLETQADYDRFQIKEGGKSLKNASMANKGAVPEPAEWIIIVLVVAAFGVFLIKWKSI